MSKVILHSLKEKLLSPDLQNALDEFRCPECAANPELSRKSKFALPSEATPSVAVPLDVMPHKIRNKSENNLMIIDHGDMRLCLKRRSNNTAPTAFNAFYSSWISVFDALVYVIVDCKSNPSAEYMKQKLHEVESQLCSVPTEAPWRIRLNECSHRYIRKSINRLLRQSQYETGYDHEVLLAEVETGRNNALHKNNVLPDFHRFGNMLRIIGSLDECP